MAKRVVASYCTTFLKPEMLHIYRQVRSLHEFDTFVMTKALQNIERFPFRDIELIPTPRTNPLRHGWLKWVKQRLPQTKPEDLAVADDIDLWVVS